MHARLKLLEIHGRRRNLLKLVLILIACVCLKHTSTKQHGYKSDLSKSWFDVAAPIIRRNSIMITFANSLSWWCISISQHRKLPMLVEGTDWPPFGGQYIRLPAKQSNSMIFSEQVYDMDVVSSRAGEIYWRWLGQWRTARCLRRRKLSYRKKFFASIFHFFFP